MKIDIDDHLVFIGNNSYNPRPCARLEGTNLYRIDLFDIKVSVQKNDVFIVVKRLDGYCILYSVNHNIYIKEAVSVLNILFEKL